MSAETTKQNPKRLIVACDGTWMNSDTGYEKSSILNPVGKIQTPSNVTRIARSFRRVCTDGRVQVINYQCGVGTGSTFSDILTGGAFGRGVAEHIREAYSFIAANYVDGDEIILLGFSRGAFTARSVAGMIGDLGLLTREGMEFYYPIFKDMENWRTPNYQKKDPFPDIPFPHKPLGDDAESIYRQRLLENGLTRVYQDGGKGPLIKVKAVAVWDTVGSLGIPKTDTLSRLGIRNSTKEFRFYDTALSDRIEHAFHALALDETRPPFRPTVWERREENRHTTDLRQVWFPGNHGNVGGGWPDQGIANLSLAWMMDQLASIGVEFDEMTIDRIFTRNKNYFFRQAAALAETETQASRHLRIFKPRSHKWAAEPLYESNHPYRVWGTTSIRKASSLFYTLAGTLARRPGMYRRIDPLTGNDTAAFLEDTNERIHSSVRVRLAVAGLGLDDKAHWEAPALLGRWRLRQTTERFYDPVERGSNNWGPRANGRVVDALAATSGYGKRAASPGAEKGGRWVWDYVGGETGAPPVRTIVEEPLGPYERHLLKLSGGEPNIYSYVEGGTVKLERDDDSGVA